MSGIAFAWPGFPDYAARCIRAVILRSPSPVSVIATRASVPVEGVEQSLGQPVHWISDTNRGITWQQLGMDRPDLLFVGGYSTPAFDALASSCRRQGGKVVLNSDNNWQATWRQSTLDPLRHRLLLRHKYDGMFVPGQSGLHFARIMGYPPDRTLTGLLGADPDLFHGGPPLPSLPKTFLFAGTFNANKNVPGLAEAFIRFAGDHRDWELVLCGNGPLRTHLPQHPQLIVHDFVQPIRLAELMRYARCLVLPSLEEHWGLVVHEAALSGCALAVSDAVGAKADLARPENAVLFRPGDARSIEQAVRIIASWDSEAWASAENMSRKLAMQFGPEKFADSIEQFMAMFDLKLSARL